MDVLAGHMDVLNVKLAEVTDKLNGLIGVVDAIVRRPPSGK
jgi:hypothetical protein